MLFTFNKLRIDSYSILTKRSVIFFLNGLIKAVQKAVALLVDGVQINQVSMELISTIYLALYQLL